MEPPTQRQFRLARWFKGVVAAKQAEGMSRSEIAAAAGKSRKDFYRYLDPETIPKSPRSETIRKICKGLKVDYAVPAAIMGWDVAEVEVGSLTDLEGKIRRLKWFLSKRTLTPEKRAEYEQRVRSLEANAERAVDGMIEELEFEPGAPQREE